MPDHRIDFDAYTSEELRILADDAARKAAERQEEERIKLVEELSALILARGFLPEKILRGPRNPRKPRAKKDADNAGEGQ